MGFAMYGYNAVLAALRAHARSILARARHPAERTQFAQEYAEYVLRNRAKLLGEARGGGQIPLRALRQAHGRRSQGDARDRGHRPIQTLWDVTTAVTAYARSVPNSDRRIELEREAGKVMQLAM